MTPTLTSFRPGDDADASRLAPDSTSTSTSTAHDAGLTWRNVDTGLWVATADGEFAGMAEQHGSDFRVTDQVARPVGTYRSLGRAFDALPLPGAGRPRGRRPLARRRGR